MALVAPTVQCMGVGDEGCVMGKVTGNWLTGAHSGRACRHEDIYTRTDRKTGACYSAKLCNPVTEWTETQKAQRVSFGAISSAISAWIKTESVKPSADYVKVKRVYDRQMKYSTLRGMMYAKGMYRVEKDGSVVVDVNANTKGAVAGGGGDAGSDNPGSGGSGGGTVGDEGDLSPV